MSLSRYSHILPRKQMKCKTRLMPAGGWGAHQPENAFRQAWLVSLSVAQWQAPSCDYRKERRPTILPVCPINVCSTIAHTHWLHSKFWPGVSIWWLPHQWYLGSHSQGVTCVLCYLFGNRQVYGQAGAPHWLCPQSYLKRQISSLPLFLIKTKKLAFSCIQN